MTLHSSCIVCSSKDIRPLRGYYNQHKLVKCNDCTFVFIEKVPSTSEVENHYSMYSYGSEGYLSPSTVSSYNSLLDEFEPFRKTGKILDVGCGRGWFLIEARKRGWEVFGTEISSAALDICHKAGLEVKAGVLDPADYDHNSFDIITSFEVIEHINNPHQQLQSINRLLRKGGLFYCTTPNFNSLLRYYLKTDYHLIAYPDHLSYYTKKTLNRVLKMNGFKPMKFLSTGLSITAIKRAKNLIKENFTHHTSVDEQLRRGIDQKWYLMTMKKITNTLLTLTNTGMSLKGYYRKE